MAIVQKPLRQFRQRAVALNRVAEVGRAEFGHRVGGDLPHLQPRQFVVRIRCERPLKQAAAATSPARNGLIASLARCSARCLSWAVGSPRWRRRQPRRRLRRWRIRRSWCASGGLRRRFGRCAPVAPQTPCRRRTESVRGHRCTPCAASCSTASSGPEHDGTSPLQTGEQQAPLRPGARAARCDGGAQVRSMMQSRAGRVERRSGSGLATIGFTMLLLGRLGFAE